MTDILATAIQEGIHAILMQETRLSVLEVDCINNTNRQWQLFQASTATTHRREAPKAGTAVFIRRNIPAVLAKKHADQDGEWIDVPIPALHIISAYRRPGINKQPWTDNIGEHLASLGSGKWFMGGDFNGTPLEDPLLIYAHSLQADVIYPHQDPGQGDEADNADPPEPLPTRWGGNSCINYSLQHGIQAPVHLRQEKYADHKLLEYNLDHQIQQQPERCFIPQPRWMRPDHVNPEDWRHQLDLQWATHQFILPPLDNTTDIDQLWNDCIQALRHTFRRAHNQAYEGRNDRPKQHTRQTKGTNPGTYLRHSHNSANSHHSTSIRLARHRRHHEYWDIHHNRTQDDSTRQLRHKLQYNLRQLGCPHPLWPSNQHHMLTWLQQEIQSIESQQQQARITAWRRRLRNSTHRTWKWLGRGKFTAQLAYISESNGEIIHTDQLIDRVHAIGKPFGHNLPRRTFNNKLS